MIILFNCYKNFRRLYPTCYVQLNRQISYDKSLSTFSNKEIVIASLLFSICKYKIIINTITNNINTPIINNFIRYVIKKTAFDHFCGGENMNDCMIRIKKYYDLLNVSTILDHSIEENDDSLSWNINLNRKLNLIKESSKYKEIKYIPLKCTALISSNLLESITLIYQMNPSQSLQSVITKLTPNEQILFYQSLERMYTLCDQARLYNIGLLLDAEQSYRQPAIEIICRILSKRYNVIGKEPIVYNTYQIYLKRSESVIKHDIENSFKENYIFAAKIVRGAYIVSETLRASQLQYENPIQSNKTEVDNSYDNIISYIIDIISHKHENSPHIIVATHNRVSIESTIASMKSKYIDSNCKNICFAQILGMCDHITIALSKNNFNSLKLICYGDYNQILPWLIRRFQENQDIFGAMQNEKSIYWIEIKNRLSNYFNFNH